MILFDLSQKFDQLNDKIISFFEKYGSNPLFWSAIVAVLFAIAYWAIQYLNRK